MQQPTLRTLAQKQVHAQKLADKAKLAGKGEKKLVDKLKKENDELKAKLVQAGTEQIQEADKEPGFKEKLSKLERRKQCLEELGDMPEEVAKVQAEIKELNASKDAAVPTGQQLRRAEQELAKRQKQCLAIDAAVAETKKKLEEQEKEKQELYSARAEAEDSLEKVKARIALPKAPVPKVSWGDIAKGHQSYFQVLSPHLLAQHGLHPEALQQLDDLLAKAAGAQKAAEEEKAAEDAKAAKEAAEATVAKKQSVAEPGTGLAMAAAGGTVGPAAMDTSTDTASAANHSLAEQMQRLANSGSGDEAAAVQTTMCLLGLERKPRSSPY